MQFLTSPTPHPQHEVHRKVRISVVHVLGHNKHEGQRTASRDSLVLMEYFQVEGNAKRA